MAEQADPRKYRGGAHEPAEAKGEGTWADNEGVVPREMVDEPEGPPPERAGDEQAVSDSYLGGLTDRDAQDDDIDRGRGDAADATSYSGTGGNVEEVKEEMQEGEPAPWPQAANVAREDQDPDRDAQT
ncbi:MAG TPA: hypothetical protein VGV67_11700 [Solirubrobacteraceae bacterium]|nr:hypothetical protein [Solirubrobacteraceae bacterium]